MDSQLCYFQDGCSFNRNVTEIIIILSEVYIYKYIMMTAAQLEIVHRSLIIYLSTKVVSTFVFLCVNDTSTVYLGFDLDSFDVYTLCYLFNVYLISINTCKLC